MGVFSKHIGEKQPIGITSIPLIGNMGPTASYDTSKVVVESPSLMLPFMRYFRHGSYEQNKVDWLPLWEVSAQALGKRQPIGITSNPT